MADYLSRKEILRVFDNLTVKNPDDKYQHGMQDAIDCLIPEVINEMESADTVKHGRWIDCTFYDPYEKSYEQNFEYKCSCCGHMIYNKPNDDNQYCGSCGARMDGDTD